MNTITIPLELTEQQVAEVTGLSVHTLRTYRARKSVLPYVKRGTRVTYRKEDVDEYLRGKYITPKKKEKKNVAEHPVRVVYPTAGGIDSD